MNFNNSNIDWSKIDEIIKKAPRILLTTHENPDGDGLGSEIGIYYHLKELGKDVRIINYSPLPTNFYFLNSDRIFETYNINTHENWITGVDLVIVFDVGDFKRTRTVADAVLKHKIKILNIDHHPHPEDHSFAYNCVDLKASATGSMVYRYLKKNRDKPIEKKSLDGLYTAVMTDTGCFKYSNTNIECHQIAIECLNSGVETHKIYQNIYENSTKPRMKLMGEFLSNINYELSDMFAWSLVTLEMLKKAKAKGNDVEGFSDMARSITGVEVAVMIFQQEETMCRINFRSKGKIIINDIAIELGGGGHPLAAGAKIEGEIKEVSKMVVDTTIKALKNKIQQLA